MQTRGRTFEESVTDALGVLHAAEVQFQEWRSTRSGPDVELELLHLRALALLTAHRGGQLGDQLATPSPVEDRHDLVDSLTSAHARLVELASGRDDMTFLSFVVDVGAVCQGVRRYVVRH